MENKFPLGALLPPELAWQENKTAASIAFVNDASRYYEAHPDMDTEDLTKLENMLRKVQTGETVLTEFLSVDDFLKNN